MSSAVSAANSQNRPEVTQPTESTKANHEESLQQHKPPGSSGNASARTFERPFSAYGPLHHPVRRLPIAKPEFVLDCCKQAIPMLPTYNGLRDKHLAGYFDKPSVRRHLVDMKLRNWYAELLSRDAAQMLVTLPTIRRPATQDSLRTGRRGQGGSAGVASSGSLRVSVPGSARSFPRAPQMRSGHVSAPGRRNNVSSATATMMTRSVSREELVRVLSTYKRMVSERLNGFVCARHSRIELRPS